MMLVPWNCMKQIRDVSKYIALDVSNLFLSFCGIPHHPAFV